MGGEADLISRAAELRATQRPDAALACYHDAAVGSGETAELLTERVVARYCADDLVEAAADARAALVLDPRVYESTLLSRAIRPARSAGDSTRGPGAQSSGVFVGCNY